MIEASAPGKVLWLGGFSVLEGNPAFVTTVDAKVRARIRERKDDRVFIATPLGRAKGRLMQDGRLSIKANDKLFLIVKSLEVTAMYLAHAGYRLRGFEITTLNDGPIYYKVFRQGGKEKIVKSGLGSSAATAVASVASLYFLIAKAVDKRKIHKLAQLSHSIATKKIGSGFDIAASTFGSIVYKRYPRSVIASFPQEYTSYDVGKLVKSAWHYSIMPLSMPDVFEPSFASFIGSSAITVSLVSAVNEFKERSPKEYWNIIGHIAKADKKAIAALKKLASGEEALEEFKSAFEEGRRYTKLLGIKSNVPIEDDDATKLIELSTEHGAFVAKLPGAGGRDSIAGLSKSIGDAKRLRRFWRSTGSLQVLNTSISNKGLDVSSRP